MYDLDSAADRLREACYQGPNEKNDGPKPFTFYLLDTQVGGWGLFCWYETKHELLNVLTRDLVGFMYSADGCEDHEVEEFLGNMREIILETPGALQFHEGMRRRINSLMVEPWEISYIGTYANLLTGDAKWERELRARFRGDNLSSVDGSAPITPEEREDFDAFATEPFE